MAARRGRSRLADLPDRPERARRASHSHPRHHSVSLLCDDIESTAIELEAKGAVFEGAIQDLGFGLGITLELPGAGGMLLYQPKHPTAYDL